MKISQIWAIGNSRAGKFFFNSRAPQLENEPFFVKTGAVEAEDLYFPHEILVCRKIL